MASAPTRARVRTPPSRRFLPPDPRVAEPYRLTPRIAVRVGILGMLALAAFALLFLRLWALQVLSGDAYLAAAQNNQLRTMRVDAPRGPILDRNGGVLVRNVPGRVIQVWPADLPESATARRLVLRRLSRVVGTPVSELEALIASRGADRLTPVTVAVAASEEKVKHLWEHASAFPGVRVAHTYLRDYRYGALAAQLLGFVGEVSPDELKRRTDEDLQPGDKTGQAGVEAAYDEYLRGAAGLVQLRVDSLGRPRGRPLPRRQPQSGNAVRTTIDVGVQRAAQQALRDVIWAAKSQSCCWAADGGAIVAMKPNGEVLALASHPSYKPSLYVGRVDQSNLAAAGLVPATAPDRNFPALNRALAGEYPAGSTFKPFVALAAMQEHVVDPYDSLPCTPEYERYEQVFKNWNPYTYASLGLPQALAQSCDTYFYELGWRFYELPPHRGSPLQKWAARMGFGQPTGIDVGGESDGLLPTPAWRKKTFTKQTDPCCWQEDRLWKPGDSIQLAIGQKDLLVTPVQMAAAYALIANGGKRVRPFVVSRVEQPRGQGSRGRVLRSFGGGLGEDIGLDATGLALVQQGLLEATQTPTGTSYGVFGGFPIPIAGKTGTAEKWVHEHGRMFDQSWWCGYGPAGPLEEPELVVCAVVENGGHGSDSAAPAARRVFEAYFGVTADPGPPIEVLSD